MVANVVTFKPVEQVPTSTEDDRFMLDMGAAITIDTPLPRQVLLFTPTIVGRATDPYGHIEDVFREIIETLEQDRAHAIHQGEVSASNESIATCVLIASYISGWLSSPPQGYKWAVFGEDDGGAMLIVTSTQTDRRVEIRISSNGLNINIISVDHNLSVHTEDVTTDLENRIQRCAAWVSRKV